MPRRTRLIAVLTVVAVAVLALDQGTKALALARLTEGERIPLLGDLFGLQLMHNPGAALSLATGMTWVFTLAAVGVTVVIVRVADRLGSRAWAVSLGLLLGGAVGNLIDRLVRPPGFARGHVVDFLAYGDWFIGNVADIAIVVAAVAIVLLTMLGIQVDGTRAGDAGHSGSGHSGSGHSGSGHSGSGHSGSGQPGSEEDPTEEDRSAAEDAGDDPVVSAPAPAPANDRVIDVADVPRSAGGVADDRDAPHP